MSNYHFSQRGDVLWGAATAAYQIEGAVRADGRQPSIWDTFSHAPGNVRNGDTGDTACDHYHRWPADVALMRELGLSAYRFSIAWPRVIPDGTGPVNQAGLDFYDRLVDELLKADITPFATLFHWDLPQALEDRGGWASRISVGAFAAYTEAVARRLGDRVQLWATHNEPWCFAFAGYYYGNHAPGRRDLRAALLAAHHALLSHGEAVQIIRSHSPNAQVGLVNALSPVYPFSTSLADQAAARHMDGHIHRWFMDPIYGRGYPEDMLAFYGDQMPPIPSDDLAIIATPTDFIGVNYYVPRIVRAVSADENAFGFRSLSHAEFAAAGYELTDMGWPVAPDGLYDLLTQIAHTYSPRAIHITESGAAFDDQRIGSLVDDRQRAAYLEAHIAAALRARAAGAPVAGFFAWSLLDNFEWAFGFARRFGIVYVDFATQERVLKTSAHWYQHFMRQQRLAQAVV